MVCSLIYEREKQENGQNLGLIRATEGQEKVKKVREWIVIEFQKLKNRYSSKMFSTAQFIDLGFIIFIENKIYRYKS